MKKPGPQRKGNKDVTGYCNRIQTCSIIFQSTCINDPKAFALNHDLSSSAEYFVCTTSQTATTNGIITVVSVCGQTGSLNSITVT